MNHVPFKSLFALTLVLFSTSCLTLLQPVDPAKQAALDARFAAKSESYGSKGAFKGPAAWAPGQFVTTGLTEQGVHKSIMRMAVVGKEGDGYIIEMLNEDVRGRTGQQMLVKGLDKLASGKSQDAAIEIVWMRVQDQNGQIQKMEGPMLNMMSMTMQGSLRKMFDLQSSQQTGDGGTVQVPAGTFKGTTRIDAEVKIMGMTVKSTTFAHPSVPLNGMVRNVSSDGKTVTDLLDFGMSGAKPSF